MKKPLTALLLLALTAPAVAEQTIGLQWTAPSDEAHPLITYKIEGKQTAAGSSDARTILGTVEADTDIALTLADGPWWLWIAPCWTDSACVTTLGTQIALSTPPYVTNGVAAIASAGSNGTISPARRDILSGTATTFTVTPDSEYEAEVGGTCGGTLDGTTYTTGDLLSNCTVVAQFVAEASGDDLTSPLVSSATINTAGDTLTVVFDEAVDLSGAIPTMESTLGSAVTLSSLSSGSSATQTWSTSRTIAPGEVLYLSYAQPGDEIEDAAGNDLLSFDALLVTNNSTSATLSTVVVTPATGTRLARGVTSTTMTVTTDAAAECVYGRNVAITMDTGTAMDTSDDLEHTATVSTYPGGLYQYCALCRDLETEETLPAVCSRFWSQTW